MRRRKHRGGLPDDPLWYKDAIIYQLHIKSFFDRTTTASAISPALSRSWTTSPTRRQHDLAAAVLPVAAARRRLRHRRIPGCQPDYGRRLKEALRAAAHARGLRVITELVINHTSDQHPWFQRARKAKPGSPARNFYVWSDTDQKYPARGSSLSIRSARTGRGTRSRAPITGIASIRISPISTSTTRGSSRTSSA